MDSSASNVTSKESGAGEAKLVLPSRRREFFKTYRQQSFSFPIDSIIYYILKNPSTPKVYQKMIQSCKYFFIKNPILFVSNFKYSDEKWYFNDKHSLNFTELLSKFWISENFQTCYTPSDNNGISINQNILCSIIPKLYRCDAKRLRFDHLIISFQDFRFLASSAENIMLNDVNLKNEDGGIVRLEKIVEILVKVKNIYIRKPTVTPETMKELIQIPHFSKLDYFSMSALTDALDLETFYAYMKTNQHTHFSLRYGNSVSAAYKARLEEIIDEIIATKELNDKRPLIDFRGLDREKHMTLISAN